MFFRCFFYVLALAVIASHRVGAKRRPMINSTKQSISPRKERMDCFVASAFALSSHGGQVAPRNDGKTLSLSLGWHHLGRFVSLCDACGSRLKLWNESGTNRARIAHSSRDRLRSPQHLALVLWERH